MGFVKELQWRIKSLLVVTTTAIHSDSGNPLKSLVLNQHSNVLVATGKTCRYRYNLIELGNPELRLQTSCLV
jgi:hypothetical protein